MASTNLFIRGDKNPSQIYIRFVEGRAIDITTKTGISINPKFFDKKTKKIRNVIDVPNRDELNSKMAKLEIFIIDEYNLAYSNGEIIDKTWLDKTIAKFFNRPRGENKLKSEPHTIYFTDFANWWLKEKSPRYKVSASKYMDERTIGHYKQLVDNVIKFEGRNKINLRDISSELIDEFSLFLTSKEKYAEQTASRKLGRFKFFCQRAEELNFEVNKNYKARVFVQKEEEDYKHPYLNEDEINKIFKLDLSYNPTLDNARDNLIIGCRTGLRVSDFLTRLTLDNIREGFIEIKTKKTGHSVTIPLHQQIEAILKKRGGLLPMKISEQKFNIHIKHICQIAEIDELMTGGIATVDKKTGIKRKVVGTYKKYELISSHVCRRSFATNHYGAEGITTKLIMDIQGWKKEEMLLNYIKSTNKESAIALKKYWEKQAQ